MNSIKDLFFFYVVPDSERLLSKLLSVPPNGYGIGTNQRFFSMRESALAEIRNLELILTNNDLKPQYAAVAHDFTVRMRRLNYPASLASAEGLYGYYDYLMRTVRPTAKELTSVKI